METLPESWSQMLAGVEQALARAEAELTLPVAPPEAVDARAGERASRWQAELRRLEGHGQRLLERLAGAEEQARAVEGSLGQADELLRQWLARSEAVRSKLANQAAASV